LKELLYFEGHYPGFLARRLNIPLPERKNYLNMPLTFGIVKKILRLKITSWLKKSLKIGLKIY